MKRIRVRTAKKQIVDTDVVSMFNQMLGAEDADPIIVIPKYKRVKDNISMISKTLTAATTNVLSKSFPDEKQGCDEIIAYVKTLDDIKFLDAPDKDTLENHWYTSMGKSKVIRKEYINDAKMLSRAYASLKEAMMSGASY